MTLPIKIEFKDYPSGSWIDWSEYLTEPPTINKRVESENEGEAGVIVFDNASVSFRYESGNPVYSAFSIDLSSKQRYLFRISAPKSNKNYVQLFEGVADFSTIRWTELDKIISFEVIDKLSALGLIPAEPARTKYYDDYVNSGPPHTNEGTNPNTNTSRQVNVQKVVPDQGDQWVDITHEWWDTSLEAWIPEYGTDNDITLYLEPGSLIQRKEFGDSNLEYVIIKQASLIDYPGSQYKAIRAEIVPDFEPGFILGTLSAYCEADGKFPYWEKELWGIDCNNVSGGILQSLDGLKVIQALYNQCWSGVTPIKKPSDLTFPIPLEYAVRLIDDEPLGGTPLEAIKILSWTLKCYIYINSAGNLVIHSKESLDTTGTARSLGTTKVISKEKNYFWDKLVDGVTVNVKSWVLDGNGEYLVGTSTQTKQIPGVTAFIKPKNEITKNLLTPDSNENTQEDLDLRAATEAAAILEFYGNRRYSYELTLDLDDNMLDGDDGPWELVDNLTIDSVQYFFTGIEMDLAARTASLTPVEVTGHEYDFRQVIVGLSESESAGVGSGSGGGGGGGIIGFLSKNIIYPEQSAYGAKGDGVTDDTAALQNAFNAAVGKTIILTREYLVTDLIEIDLGGDSINIAGNNNSKIISTATISNTIYYAFWVARRATGFTYPSVGAVYSNNGSNFEVIDDTITVDEETKHITERILTQKISGANAPLASGTLSKVSGTGNATYDYADYLNGQYYLPTGAVHIKHGIGVRIDNVNFEFNNTMGFERTVGPYFDGLLIEDSVGVRLNDVTCIDAPHRGILLKTVSDFYISNCKCEYNLFAGLCCIGAVGGVITGGSYSYNGIDSPINGYGIALQHRSGYWVDNEDILITGVTANYNLRKGLDSHGSIRCKFIANDVKGFVFAGISVVGAGGSEEGHTQYVRDTDISYNDLENDPAWFDSIEFVDDGVGPLCHPIQIGSYGDVEGTYGGGHGGTFSITHNTFKDCTVYKDATLYTRYLIHSFGGPAELIQIKDNSGDETECVGAAIYVGSGAEYGQPKQVDISGNNFREITAISAVIWATVGEIINVSSNKIRDSEVTGATNAAVLIAEFLAGASMKQVNVNNNIIDGTFDYGIKVKDADFTNVLGNNFKGIFSTNYFYMGTDLRFLVKNNIVDIGITPQFGASISLPDMISKSSGEACYSVETSGASSTINTFIVKADEYVGGTATFNIEIIGSSANNAYHAVFYYIAQAGNVDDEGEPSNIVFNAELYRISSYAGDPMDVGFQPIVQWYASGNQRTLRIVCPGVYCSYQIKINYSAWHLTPYQSRI